MIEPYTANISFAMFFSIGIESLNDQSNPFLHYFQEVRKYNYMNLWRLLGGTSQIRNVHVSIYLPGIQCIPFGFSNLSFFNAPYGQDECPSYLQSGFVVFYIPNKENQRGREK